jgi:hypothetical protein
VVVKYQIPVGLPVGEKKYPFRTHLNLDRVRVPPTDKKLCPYPSDRVHGVIAIPSCAFGRSCQFSHRYRYQPFISSDSFGHPMQAVYMFTTGLCEILDCRFYRTHKMDCAEARL